MPTDTSKLLSLPYIQPSQSQKHVTHNEAIRALDAIVQLGVASRTQTAPPASPTDGDRYIVPVGATGAWAAQDNNVAILDGENWVFVTPQSGWQAYVAETNAISVFDGALWGSPTLEAQNAEGLGIQTSWDATNRLAVRSAATLLSHDGAGHQLKLNKQSDTDTASLLFQTNWSGRAEMGTNGDDDFSIKVSADGSTWADALQFDGGDAAATFGGDITTDSDVYARRFMASSVDFPYLVSTIDNSHPSAAASIVQFSFSGTRRYALGVYDSNEVFNLTAYSPDGSWRGSPLVIEYADTDYLTNALYINSKSNVGIGKVPVARLDIDGEAKLKPMPKASLPAAGTIGTGGIAYVTDATSGAGLAYCDGTDWRTVRDDALV